MVRMHAALGLWFKHPVIGLKTRNEAIHVERTAAVGHIDALCAITLHQLSLFR
mgnify:CR=1 FL=1